MLAQLSCESIKRGKEIVKRKSAVKDNNNKLLIPFDFFLWERISVTGTEIMKFEDK